jgi:methionine-rich copper-binding protein CopC
VIALGTPLRSRHALGVALAGLVLALIALVWTAAPASAHDELLSSDPAAGTTVDELPAAITLSFSAELLSDGSSTVVQVTDAAGSALVDGAPIVDGAVVTQPLTSGSAGTVSVAWRVVSSDGHPISGEFSFEAASAAPAPTPTSEPTASASATSAPTTTAAAPTESSTPAPTETTESGTIDALPWVIGAVILVVVIALVVWLLAARARQQRKDSQDRTAGRSDPDER